MKIQRIEFPCGAITLEGMISLPEGPGPFGLVVVCHPHPLYGGNMFNNVVHAVCEPLIKKGIAWLKFNFRGVGKSGGSYSDGIGEQEDAQSAISFGEKQGLIEGGRIGICGYSFGSMVAFAAAVKDPRVRAVAGISPFIQPPDLLDFYSHPKLFVSGDLDEFVHPRELEKQVERLPAPKELVFYPGVDHFWMKEDDSMAEKVGQFFKSTIGIQP
jgi:uncharacterized protein